MFDGIVEHEVAEREVAECDCFFVCFCFVLFFYEIAYCIYILCGASLGRGNESLYKWSRSHDQDGHHAHIW